MKRVLVLRPETETTGSPTYVWREEQQALIVECPCSICQCPELSEDGALCRACRLGYHEADQE